MTVVGDASLAVSTPVGAALEAVRRSRTLVILGHAVLAGQLFLLTVIGLGTFPVEHPVLGAAVSTALLAGQLALAFGRLGRWRRLVYAAILGLSVGLLPVLGTGWLGSFWFAGAATALTLPGRPAAAVCAASLAVWVAKWVDFGAEQQWSTGYFAAGVSYVLVIGPFGTAALVALARLTDTVDRLREARAAVAEQAAVSERGRVSRDLHDVLGQSLSAIALKSDLALRLLEQDRPAAARQIEDLEQIAQALANEAEAVTSGQVQLTTVTEADRAAALLHAAGIDTHLSLDAARLSPSVDALFGWAVREGATNVLRHSAATACAITTTRTSHGVHLEIVNDGAPPRERGGQGSGLLGLQARARALGGRVDAAPTPDRRYCLRVDIPQSEP